MLVRGRMTPDVVTVAPSATVQEALELIREHDIRHLPVMEGDRLVGVATDRDLRLAIEPGTDTTTVDVADLMSTAVTTVAPDLPVESAARLLIDERIGCLPVLEDGQLVGILTETDLIRALVELMVGRQPHSRVEVMAPDRPGELARVVRLIGIDHGVNITGVVVPPPTGDRAVIVLHLECDDASNVVQDLRRLGYEADSPTLPERSGAHATPEPAS